MRPRPWPLRALSGAATARSRAGIGALVILSLGGGPPARATPGPPAPSWAPPEEATIAELQAAMQSGRTTARAIAEAYLQRIRAVDPKLRSIAEINPDALAIADALDRERREKGPRGPLHGIPVVVKDNIATGRELTAQMETTAGSLVLLGHKPPRDAFVVARLRAAGAIVLAKTNLSEWANIRSPRSVSGWSARGGVVRNPYALDRSACGSSSGSAAAVAANLAAVGVGTETDGSIICPSAMNGLVGLKPTVGLLSRRGIVPLSRTQDTPGPMARTVADVALLLAALAGVDPDDPAMGGAPPPVDYGRFLQPGALLGKRIGVARAKVLGLDPAADRVALAAIEVLKSKGAVIIDPADIAHLGEYDRDETDVMLYELNADLPVYLKEWAPTAPVKSLADVVAWNRAHATEELRWFGQELFERAIRLGPLTDPKYRRSLARCRRLGGAEGLEATFAKHRLDALLAPSNSPPWLTDLVNGDHFGMASTTPAAVAGTPALTVPAGEEHGLPMAVTFMGRRFDEGTLLGIGYAFEQATRARQPPRLLSTLALEAPGRDTGILEVR